MIANMQAKQAGNIRVVSLNLNGMRSAVDKGVLDWMNNSDADVICLQETRIQTHQWLDAHKPEGWYTHIFPAQKAGYAGTGIYSRQPLVNLTDGLGFEICDSEGRFCAADYTKADGSVFTIASVYFPSGSSGDAAQAKKDAFLIEIEKQLKHWHEQKKSIILCGDVNIAHKQIDIKNWKGNLKNSGFLPHERAWVDTLLASGYIDSFRIKNQNADEYSWWSNRGQARANNVGWRIDYQFASEDWLNKVEQVSIYRDVKYSDHAPVIVDYQL